MSEKKKDNSKSEWIGRRPRQSPEFIADAGMGEGGLSVSGGIAGGADPGAAKQQQTEHDSAQRTDE